MGTTKCTNECKLQTGHWYDRTYIYKNSYLQVVQPITLALYDSLALWTITSTCINTLALTFFIHLASSVQSLNVVSLYPIMKSE